MVFVERSLRDHVATITLARPEALNAISGAVAVELAAAFREMAADPDAWVVILGAAGDRAFCVGADLKERAGFDDAAWLENRARIRELFASIRETPQPTIAAVFGFALGGGFELALSCDLIVAAENAVLGLPETGVGIVPGGGGTQLLARAIGPSRARDVILSRRRLSVEEAHAAGLVARIAPPDGLGAAARALAEDIRRSSPVAVREAKRAIGAAFDLPLAEGLEVEGAAWEAAVASEDRREGIAAFNEKREARWRNR